MANVREFIEKYRPWTVQFIYYLNGQYYKDIASVLDDNALDLILDKADFPVYSFSYFNDLHLLILSI